MTFFHVHPDEVVWLRRWLRGNLICCLAIVCFALAIRFDPSVSPEPMKLARASLARGYNALIASPPDDRLPPESELILLTSRPANPIAPQGWRRTDQGWEHVSTWSLPRPLGEIIEGQRDREPAWLQLTLARLRDVPPLVFGMLQIAAIALIVRFTRYLSPSPARRGVGYRSKAH
jgi:hypothetical protein